MNAENSYKDLLEQSGVIGEKDVLRFRREVFADGIVSQVEADAVFALNDGVEEKCDAWSEFFVEAICEYTVNQAEPRGYVSVENANWLMRSISRNGVVETGSELELLVKILAKATSCPQTLIQFAMLQVSVAVIEGEGALTRGREFTKGAIGEAEVEMLRTILYAAGSESNMSISKQEAEILVQLNERTDGAENHPSWQDFFVRATANYLMAACGAKAPSRDEALARQEWLEDTETDTAGFVGNVLSGFGNMFTPGFFDDVFTSSHVQMERAWKRRNEAQHAANMKAEAIDADEARWLVERINKDGVINDNEKALLAFIREESNSVDPAVQELFSKVA